MASGVLSFVLTVWLGCQNAAPYTCTVQPAFYHWKTHLRPSQSERQLLDSLGARILYVKFFDVDLNENKQPVPLAQVEVLDTTALLGLRIVPTVFIANRTLRDISRKEIETLANRVVVKVEELYAQFPRSHIDALPEWQFDCDWTNQTKENYFYFLASVRSILATRNPAQPPTVLSATIRLHQLKYPDRTGVPPVDKGMLMCYNTGTLDDWETENAILDLATAGNYFSPNNQPYPLPLDVALPVFKWGVVFRNQVLVFLINNLDGQDLTDEARFQKLQENRFEVVGNTYLEGHYLYEGDLIRLEGTTPGLLIQAAAMINANLDRLDERVLSFYHLDSVALEGFRCNDFKKVIGPFSR